MKVTNKRLVIPLQDIDEIIEAGRYGLKEHESRYFSEDIFNPWDYIESSTATLQILFGKYLEEYEAGRVQCLIAFDPGIKVFDKVRISGNRMHDTDDGQITYKGLTGVVLDILPSGNLWIGFSSKFPNDEFSLEEVELIPSLETNL